MGRPTKAEQLKRQAATAEIVERYSQAIVSVAKFIVVEGFTVGSAIMIWRVSGEVLQYDKDGNETPEWAIRSALIDGMYELRNLMLKEIPLLGIAPLAWMEPIMRAYEAMLNKTSTQPNRFLAMPIVERLELIIFLPAMLRTILEMLKGLLSKG